MAHALRASMVGTFLVALGLGSGPVRAQDGGSGDVTAAAEAIVAAEAAIAARGNMSDGAISATPDMENGRIIGFAPLVRATVPAVVNIYAERIVRDEFRSPFANDPFFGQLFERFFADLERPRIENSLGSGAVVDPSGLIVTNNHVIREGMDISVDLADGRTFPGRVVARSVGFDLAFIQLNTGTKETFPYLAFADSDVVEVGDLVLALGNPFGIGQTVTSGIVSGLGRSLPLQKNLRALIQTDAAINPGNSGGPLVDIRGRIIGVNTVIFSKSGTNVGVGFAIPANIVSVALRHAREGNSIRFAWPGISLGSLPTPRRELLKIPAGIGVTVKDVFVGGPGDRAGFDRDDIIVEVGGKIVYNADQFRALIQGYFPEGEVVIKGFQANELTTFRLPLEVAPASPAPDLTRLGEWSVIGGMTVANLSPALAEDLNVSDLLSGVVVVDVVPGSSAGRLGLRAGDRLLSINDRKLEDVQTLVSLAEKTRQISMIVDRGGRRYSLATY